MNNPSINVYLVDKGIKQIEIKLKRNIEHFYNFSLLMYKTLLDDNKYVYLVYVWKSGKVIR